jgi:hypothetical protein
LIEKDKVFSRYMQIAVNIVFCSIRLKLVERLMEYFSGVITLQFIFSRYWAAYCNWYTGKIRTAVKENVRKIIACRTPQLGFHLYQCPTCSAVRLVPHSCKSRFCSSCGKVATDQWSEERLSDILAVGYHHLVFTLPWQLRKICLVNRREMFDLLFLAVAHSIMIWAAEYGGYRPGIYIVLHTFGSDLKFNPHFHVIVTAGGLSLDKRQWISAAENFLMPAAGLKKRWRYNVIKAIIEKNNKNLLQMPYLPKQGRYINLRGVISVISKLNWYVFIGARLLDIGMTVKYIGRYTKRPVIAETRILHCDNKWVIFQFKDYAEGGKSSVKKMRLFTFITYLIQHIPDKSYRLVRGYGLFSSRLKGELLPRVRTLLGQTAQKEAVNRPTWRERRTKESGKDPLLCENCSAEMSLVLVCFKPHYTYLAIFAITVNERIPNKQFQFPNKQLQLFHDSS